MDKRYANSEKYLAELAQHIIDQARLELKAKRKSPAIRAKWERSGNKWRLKSFVKKKITKQIDDTGRLRKSLAFEIVQTDDGALAVDFLMEDYGLFVDQGRRKGKGAPVPVIRTWVKTKPLRLRNLETGAMIKRTPQNIKSAAYLVNRKIKHFGIEPTYFFTEPFDLAIGNVEDGLTPNMIKDIENAIQQPTN